MPRGWAEYFRYGNSSRHLAKIRRYALERLALLVAKRHHKSRGYGWSVVAFRSPDQLGLIRLDGIVVAPRPGKAWRERPNAGGERRR
ncbi:MAG: group II intron maturase-specific domain-containing protein [Egibacteraceae bacterium]